MGKAGLISSEEIADEEIGPTPDYSPLRMAQNDECGAAHYIVTGQSVAVSRIQVLEAIPPLVSVGNEVELLELAVGDGVRV